MRPQFLLVLAVLAILTAVASTPTLAQPLDELRWKKRVVIICAPAGSEKKLAQQQELFRTRDAAFRERDVVQILLRKPADQPEIAQRFKLTGSQFEVLLLGKDGGEKFRSAEVVQPETLFRRIDSMPMRQEEQRSRDANR